MEKTTITKIEAQEILDSRGNPTIRAFVTLNSRAVGKASVPSGASTGKHEALELRDGDPSRFLGKGVLKAVSNVKDIIAPEITGLDALNQEEIDKRLIALDGTSSKKNLGANAILSVSMVVACAASQSVGQPLYRYLSRNENFRLPVPQINILNGGSHADNNVDIQEFLIVPAGRPNFSEAIRAAAEVFQNLKILLRQKGYSTAVGDEGGFAPNLKSNEEAFDLIMDSIANAGYTPGQDIFLAIDVAASELYSDKNYTFKKSTGMTNTAEEMIDFYQKLTKNYPLISIEDGLAEDDWPGWKKLTDSLGQKIQIVGDDIFVTNLQRFKKGVAEGIANSILIKLNQIGTLSETIETVSYAHKMGYSTVISHRSGETEDTFIADLSVAVDAGQIKTGSLSRSERVAKYNRLLEIEKELKGQGSYAGTQVFNKYLQ